MPSIKCKLTPSYCKCKINLVFREVRSYVENSQDMDIIWNLHGDVLAVTCGYV